MGDDAMREKNSFVADNWDSFVEIRKDKPVRDLVVQATQFVKNRGKAIDLGAGALNTTKYLLAEKFAHVDSVEPSQKAAELAEQIKDERLHFHNVTIEDFQFPEGPEYDLENAEFSLPFMQKGTFEESMRKILASLKPGGIFTGQLFGVSDEWNVPGAKETFLTRDEALAFFNAFEMLKFEEENKPGSTAKGNQKLWHIFHIIARKA